MQHWFGEEYFVLPDCLWYLPQKHKSQMCLVSQCLDLSCLCIVGQKKKKNGVQKASTTLG